MKQFALGELIGPAKTLRAGNSVYPVLSMTMHEGLVDQERRFKKRIASSDLSEYKVVRRSQLVVGFPIDEGVLDFQELYPEGIVSPAYGIWDILDDRHVDRRYLKLFLRSPQALAYYKAKLRGSTARRRSLPNPIFLAQPIPLPPLPEQRRIAAILDHADALRAKRRQILTRLETLAQSIFHDMFRELEADKPLGQVAKIQGGLQVSAKRVALPVEVPYLRVANVHRNKLDLTEVKSLRGTVSEVSRTQLTDGDLLFVEGHANPNEVGRVAVWTGAIPGCVHQNHLIRARLNREFINPAFATYWFNSERGAQHFRRAGKTTSGLNTISASTVRSAPTPLPSIRSQMEFARSIDQIGRQRAVEISASEATNDLFTSLQARAFRGEL
ncbi:restriction endonuclease subunit S [Millisia brevis]|uniref:restriction endonuclease subunit S n=1 Tax=Millisia brevis TaxID=264148 RepID=UPI00082D61D3|nr:restriction endonuclease subunit S [Millisia brevis]